MILEEAQRRRLEAWLARAAGAEDFALLEVRPLSGGAIQENWLLVGNLLGGPLEGHHCWVLRRDAASKLPHSLTRAQEFAVLRVAQSAGVAVPQPLWLCEDPAVLGGTFYVMRKVEGIALGSKVVKDSRHGGEREALGERLGEELAKIHAIRPPRRELAFLEPAPRSPALAAIAAYRRQLDGLGRPRPALEWALAWAERHRAVTKEIVFLHNDFRTGNYIIDEHGLAAILDWEFAGWGDPMSDLGWFCARCWRFGRNDLEAGGIASREAFYRGYGRRSGREIDEAAVAFWEVMAHLRWAVIALYQGDRHLSGREFSLDLALTGRRIAELEFALLDMTPPDRWSNA